MKDIQNISTDDSIKYLDTLSYNNILDQAMQMANLTPYSSHFNKNSIISSFSNFVNIYKKHTNSDEISHSLDISLDCLSNPMGYSYYTNILGKTPQNFIVALVMTTPNMSSCVIYKTNDDMFKVVFSVKNDNKPRSYHEYYIPSSNINKILDYLGYGKENNFSIHEFLMELEIASIGSKDLDIDLSTTDFETSSPFTEIESILNFTYKSAFPKNDKTNIVYGPISVRDTHVEFLNNLKKEVKNFSANKIENNNTPLFSSILVNRPNVTNVIKDKFSLNIDELIDIYSFNKNFSDTVIKYNTLSDISLNDLINLYNCKKTFSPFLHFDNPDLLKKDIAHFNIKNILENFQFFYMVCSQLEPKYCHSLDIIQKYCDKINNNIFPSLEEFKDDFINSDIKELFPVAVDDFCRSYSYVFLDLAKLSIEGSYKNYNYAKEIYDFLCSQYPYNSQFLFNRGKFYEKLGLYSEALEDFKNASYIDPNFIDIKYHCAILYSCLGNREKSLDICRKILDITPNSSVTKNLKEFLSKVDTTIDNEKIFNTAISIIWDNTNNFILQENMTNSPTYNPLQNISGNKINTNLPKDKVNIIDNGLNKTDYVHENPKSIDYSSNPLPFSTNKQHNMYFSKLTDNQIEHQFLQTLGHSYVPNDIDKTEFLAYFSNLTISYDNKFCGFKDENHVNFLNSLKNSLSCLENNNNYISKIQDLTQAHKNNNFIIAPVFHNSSWSNVIISQADNLGTFDIIFINSISNTKFQHFVYNIDARNIDELTKFLGYNTKRGLEKKDFLEFLDKKTKFVTSLDCNSNINYVENNFSTIENAFNVAYSTSFNVGKYDDELNAMEYLMGNRGMSSDISTDLVNKFKNLSDDEFYKKYDEYFVANNEIIRPIDFTELQNNNIENILFERPELFNDINDITHIVNKNYNFRYLIYLFNKEFSININDSNLSDTAIQAKIIDNYIDGKISHANLTKFIQKFSNFDINKIKFNKYSLQNVFKNITEEEDLRYIILEKCFKENFPYKTPSELASQLETIDYTTFITYSDFFIELCQNNNLDIYADKLTNIKILYNEIKDIDNKPHTTDILEFNDYPDLKNLSNFINKMARIQKVMSDNPITSEKMLNPIVSSNSITNVVHDYEAYFPSIMYSLCDEYVHIIYDKTNNLNNITLLGNPPFEEISKLISALDSAIEIMPNNFSSYSKRGLLHAINGNKLSALTDFVNAVTNEPNNLNIKKDYATALYVLGEKNEAILECNKILSIDPNFLQAKKLKETFQSNSFNFQYLPKNIENILKTRDLKNTHTTVFEHYKSKNSKSFISKLLTSCIRKQHVSFDEKNTIASSKVTLDTPINMDKNKDKNKDNTKNPPMNF